MRKGFLALLATLALAGLSACSGAHMTDTQGHEGHLHEMNEKGQWTCSHCGGDYDGPGKCKNSYCKMDLVKKVAK